MNHDFKATMSMRRAVEQRPVDSNEHRRMTEISLLTDSCMVLARSLEAI